MILFTKVSCRLRGLRTGRLTKHACLLVAGDAIASVMSFGAFALTAKMLGVGGFGKLTLITTFALIVDGLVNFQSWKALIKYGAAVLGKSYKGQFASLIKYGFTIDCITAGLATVVAAIGSYFIGELLHWDAVTASLASAYSIVILFRLTGAPLAVLRLFERFDLIFIQKIVAAGLRLLGVCAAVLAKGDLVTYLIVWGAADIISNLLLILMSVVELKRNKITNILSAPLREISVAFPGIRSFFWTTNLYGVAAVIRQADILLVGRLVGVDSVGLYKVAKQLASLLSRVIEPVYTALYPEMARLEAKSEREKFNKLVIRSSIALGLFLLMAWSVFIFAGRDLLGLAFGAEYIPAYSAAVWCTLAIALWGFSQAYESAMLALGYPRLDYQIHAVLTAIYFILLYFMIEQMDILGAGLAFFGFQLMRLISIGGVYYYLMYFKRPITKQAIPLMPETVEVGYE